MFLIRFSSPVILSEAEGSINDSGTYTRCLYRLLRKPSSLKRVPSGRVMPEEVVGSRDAFGAGVGSHAYG